MIKTRNVIMTRLLSCVCLSFNSLSGGCKGEAGALQLRTGRAAQAAASWLRTGPGGEVKPAKGAPASQSPQAPMWTGLLKCFPARSTSFVKLISQKVRSERIRMACDLEDATLHLKGVQVHH